MKKRSLLLFIIFFTSYLYAQKFEIIREYKFGNPIAYTETWDPIEGGHPGIYRLQVWNNKFLILNEGLYSWHLTDDLTQLVKFDNIHFPNTFYYTNEIMLFGEPSDLKLLNVYTKSKDLTKPDYILDFNKDIITGEGGIYYTEGKLFFAGGYFELLPDGQIKYHNDQQTKKEMEEGLAEHLGIVNDDEGIYFGETCITTSYPPNYKYYWKDIKIITDKYKNLGSIGSYIGTDKKGISYFYKLTNSANEKRPRNNPDLPITVLICALDSWTHEACVISLPEGDWNPSRNKNGLIAVCS